MTRVGNTQLQELANACAGRRRQIVEATHDLKLVSGRQLQRLFFAGGRSLNSDRRHAARELRWLTEHRLLHRLERRIGGTKAGSHSFIYCLGPVGRRAIKFWRGRGLDSARSTWEPGAAFVDHTLATTELFVRLHESDAFEVIDWQPEPECWRSHTGPFGEPKHLKPDAFVVVSDDEFERLWFVEIDRGTERLATLRRKFQAYADYEASGAEQRESGLFPHVLWVAPNEERSAVLAEIGSNLRSVCTFVTATDASAVDVMSGDRP